MKLREFKKNKIRDRAVVNGAAIKALKDLSPVAIHHFGSGTVGFRDEFSDLDLFTTLEDSAFEDVVAKRKEIYSQIAPILLRLHSDKHHPVGWYHDLIIHEYEGGLFHIDYFLVPRSKVILPPGSKVLFGEDQFPRGENWTIQGTNSSGETAGLLEGILAMSYIGVKGIVRNWGPEFYNYLRSLYDNYQKQTGKKFEELPLDIDFQLIYAILDNVKSEGQDRQKLANRKVKKYAEKVEKLYSSK